MSTAVAVVAVVLGCLVLSLAAVASERILAKPTDENLDP